MKNIFLLLMLTLFASCTNETLNSESGKGQLSIVGTWELMSVKTIEGTDTLIDDFTTDIKGIKIINNSHFSFLQHDLVQGKDSTALFVSGGGKYILDDNHYTEYLEYCNYREWEDNKFEFDLTMYGDTLIQKGIEEVEEIGIDRIIIETYIRVKE